MYVKARGAMPLRVAPEVPNGTRTPGNRTSIHAAARNTGQRLAAFMATLRKKALPNASFANRFTPA